MTSKSRFLPGPAVLVTAAFIGPGTVFTASNAGHQFGFTLLWAVAFSVIATIVLQEMAARLGIVTGAGLSQALQSNTVNRAVRVGMLLLIVVAILIGNAAYQTGNIVGAARGVVSLELDATIGNPFGDSQWQNAIVLTLGVLTLALIWIGRFDVLQIVLTLLVVLMSGLFVVAAFRCGPDWGQVLRGFTPRIPTGSELMVVSLIGTTVVPYNLFLHASAAAQLYRSQNGQTPDEQEILAAVGRSRWDTVCAVLVGGLVTCAILVTSSVAAQNSASPDSLSRELTIASQLEPALGSWAKTMLAIGLAAAGLTSAITAPIAAAYATAGCFGWPEKLSDWRLKLTATGVVLVGVWFGIRFGKSPSETIVLAQFVNGLLLPIVAVFLFVIVNRVTVMGRHRNRMVSNVLGVAVLSFVIFLNGKKLIGSFSKLIFPPAATAPEAGDSDDDSPPVPRDN